MNNKIVISLYDYTGEALRPWAEAGYLCYAFDIQHPKEGRVDRGICYQYADLHDHNTLNEIQDSFADKNVVFAMAFPVCTDLAVSGAAHFKKKAEANPSFQQEAVSYAVWCSRLFNSMGVPYFVENPVSVLASQWRRPDHYFHPYEYGGYIKEADAKHPTWPEYIAERDAYPKKTCLWIGGGFNMPTVLPVPVEKGYATQHLKLGGKSMKTKNIRSATPRGFATAVYEANKNE